MAKQNVVRSKLSTVSRGELVSEMAKLRVKNAENLATPDVIGLSKALGLGTPETDQFRKLAAKVKKESAKVTSRKSQQGE